VGAQLLQQGQGLDQVALVAQARGPGRQLVAPAALEPGDGALDLGIVDARGLRGPQHADGAIVAAHALPGRRQAQGEGGLVRGRARGGHPAIEHVDEQHPPPQLLRQALEAGQGHRARALEGQRPLAGGHGLLGIVEALLVQARQLEVKPGDHRLVVPDARGARGAQATERLHPAGQQAGQRAVVPQLAVGLLGLAHGGRALGGQGQRVFGRGQRLLPAPEPARPARQVQPQLGARPRLVHRAQGLLTQDQQLVPAGQDVGQALEIAHGRGVRRIAAEGPAQDAEGALAIAQRRLGHARRLPQQGHGVSGEGGGVRLFHQAIDGVPARQRAAHGRHGGVGPLPRGRCHAGRVRAVRRSDSRGPAGRSVGHATISRCFGHPHLLWGCLARDAHALSGEIMPRDGAIRLRAETDKQP
jgi:hypothetical protein